jgi:predicted metalloprotease with PDZ domain
MLDLPENLFGACFRRVSEPVRRYLPGFQVDVTPDAKHRVGQISVASPAASAGLKKGDEILNWTVIDKVKKLPGTSLRLELRDATGSRKVQFDPWGDAYEGTSWIKATSRPHNCSL